MRFFTPGTVLAATALALAFLAPVAGGPDPFAGPGVAELSQELADGRAVVDAVTVAEWIRDRQPVRVVDVRDSSAFIRFRVPTARNVAFGELAGLSVDSSRALVVYDDGDGAAVRAWLLLRRLGHPRVRVLDKGVMGWIDGVISPVLPTDTPQQRARYDRVAAVSRYFGGLPQVGTPPPETDAAAEDAVRLLSRRGCY